VKFTFPISLLCPRLSAITFIINASPVCRGATVGLRRFKRRRELDLVTGPRLDRNRARDFSIRRERFFRRGIVRLKRCWAVATTDAERPQQNYVAQSPSLAEKRRWGISNRADNIRILIDVGLLDNLFLFTFSKPAEPGSATRRFKARRLFQSDSFSLSAEFNISFEIIVRIPTQKRQTNRLQPDQSLQVSIESLSHL